MAIPSSPFSAVAKTLKGIIEVVTGTGTVMLEPPTKDAITAGSLVSLWLYQVAIDEFSRNRPPPQIETANARKAQLLFAPLGVNLSYLITPLVNDQEEAQNLLAAIMLALYEAAQTAVDDAASEVSGSIAVSFVPDTLDDRVKLWEALGEPYRLSACYLVRTVRLISKLTATDTPVVTAASLPRGAAPPG
jgi:hypothetical protein